MKLNSLFLVLLALASSAAHTQDTLLLFHPTVNNLETIWKLDSSELLCLDGYHILGVCHEKEVYDFSHSRQWIDKHPSKNTSLLVIGKELKPETIFMKNTASEVFRSLFLSSRGALFMGGPDIPPETYGEKCHLATEINDPFRHYLELSYLFHLLGGKQNEEFRAYMEDSPEYLVSGICLGMQSMNVATGGSMVQDIPMELYGLSTVEEVLSLPQDQRHRNYEDRMGRDVCDPTSYHFHRIRIEKGSFISEHMKFDEATGPLVLSSHHQAVEKTGLGWKIVARSMDTRIVEAIEHFIYPHVFGVQFHPEKPGLFDPAIEHMKSCSEKISFREGIAGTNAHEFHIAYWAMLGRILQENLK